MVAGRASISCAVKCELRCSGNYMTIDGRNLPATVTHGHYWPYSWVFWELGIVFFRDQTKLTSLAWAVCFPILDQVIFSGELFFYLSKIYS